MGRAAGVGAGEMKLLGSGDGSKSVDEEFLSPPSHLLLEAPAADYFFNLRTKLSTIYLPLVLRLTGCNRSIADIPCF